MGVRCGPMECLKWKPRVSFRAFDPKPGHFNVCQHFLMFGKRPLDASTEPGPEPLFLTDGGGCRVTKKSLSSAETSGQDYYMYPLRMLMHTSTSDLEFTFGKQ